jgi:hypothetical protein
VGDLQGASEPRPRGRWFALPRLGIALAILVLLAVVVGARPTLRPAPVGEIRALPAAYRTDPAEPVAGVDPWAMLRGESAPPPDPDIVVPHLHIEGIDWRHPSRQGEVGLRLVDAYDRSGDVAYLAGAERIARDLVDHAVAADGAIHLVYDFAWYGVEPPWHSALSQAKALALTSRLAVRIGGDEWRAAADRLFASFLLPAGGERWYTFVDERGSLWFEEAPDADEPGRILNGHISAVWGIADYWVLTGDATARDLLAGGLATVKDRWDEFRVPADISRYGLGDGAQMAQYHAAHILQLRALAALTGDEAFATMALELEQDLELVHVRGIVGQVLAIMASGVALLLGSVIVRRGVAAILARRRVGDMAPETA